MNSKLKTFLGVVVLLVLGFVLGVLGTGRNGGSFGGTTYDASRLVGDVYNGLAEVLMFRNGEFVGPIDTAQSVAVSGTFTATGASDLATTTTGYLAHGGLYTSISTTSATYTLSATEFQSAFVDVESVALAEALTLTLPATSTGAYADAAGDTVYLKIKNSHTGAATTTTIAAGTGVDLQEPDGQNVVIGITNYAYAECTTLDTTDVVCKIDETIPAD